MCKEYGALPDIGGVHDQDDYVIRGLTHVIKAVAEKERIDAEKAKSRANKRKR